MGRDISSGKSAPANTETTPDPEMLQHMDMLLDYDIFKNAEDLELVEKMDELNQLVSESPESED